MKKNNKIRITERQAIADHTQMILINIATIAIATILIIFSYGLGLPLINPSLLLALCFIGIDIYIFYTKKESLKKYKIFKEKRKCFACDKELESGGIIFLEEENTLWWICEECRQAIVRGKEFDINTKDKKIIIKDKIRENKFKCNTCGKIICYSGLDDYENFKNMK